MHGQRSGRGWRAGGAEGPPRASAAL